MENKHPRIITLPHSSLRKRSSRIGIVTEETRQLVENMKSATIAWEETREHEVGVALAAVQINQLYRVIVVREDFNDKTNKKFDAFINPEIVKYEGEIEEDFEGCLSVADVYGKVPRHTKIRVKALSMDGKEVRLRAEGFLARVIQHEIDHTVGKLFVDHIKGKPEAFFKLGTTGKIEELEDEERQAIFRILW